MAIETLLVQDAIGETRAAALDEAGRPVALFQDRWAEQGKRLRWGQVVSGHIRKLSRADGGAFIRLETGLEGFLARRDLAGLIEGAAGTWQVAAEARAGKLARLTEAEETGEHRDPFALWQAALPGGGDLQAETGLDVATRMEAIFDDALAPCAPLSGGGRLQISPTPALVAVDVDTLGRTDKGRASARARRVGIVAAEELARQAALRGLGGNLVLDCIGPLARRDGPDLKQAFLTTFRAVSTRRAECLPPSPFGLMEAVLEWRARPVQEACLDARGEPLPLANLLDGLRQIEREARARPADRLCLGLPEAAYAALAMHRKLYETGLIERFGGRIDVAQSSRNQIEISSR